jgi:hypothetical protein
MQTPSLQHTVYDGEQADLPREQFVLAVCDRAYQCILADSLKNLLDSGNHLQPCLAKVRG